MNKLKKIKKIGVTSLIMWVMSIILFVISFVMLQIKNNYPKEGFLEIVFIVFLSLATAAIISGAIISLVGSIFVLTTDFENKKTDDSKILWGILSLLLLGPIGLLTFSIINIKKISIQPETTDIQPETTDIKTETTDIKNDVVESTTDIEMKLDKNEDKLDVVKRAFKMYEEGIITKEEFDKVKEKNL